MSSVLAKLMHIDNLSISHSTTTHQTRHRVLSENYLQNIASITKRERVFLLPDDSDSGMGYPIRSSASSNSLSASQKRRILSEQSKGTVVQEQRLSSFCNGMGSSIQSSASSYSSSVNQKQRNSFAERIKGSPVQSSASSNSSFVGQKQRNSFAERSKGSPIQSTASSQEIAKQITGQVKHSAWHNCAELSSFRCRSESSSENKEERIAPFTPSETKHKASSFSSHKGSTITTTGSQKSVKKLTERWRTGISSEAIRKSSGSKIGDEVLVSSSSGSTSVTNATEGSFNARFCTSIKGRPVLCTRYLSKPTLFPSAWVPRSRAKHFTLNKSWSLKAEKMGTKHCSNSKEESKEVQSTLDSEKPSSRQIASFNESVTLAKQNLCKDTYTSLRYPSNKSQSSDLGSPSFHEAHIVLDENEANHSEKEDSQDSAVEFLPSICDLGPLSSVTEEFTDEGNEEMNTYTKFRMDNLSGDEDSFKYQLKLKNHAREPRSPVSSLEGPEDCNCSMNLIVQAAEYLSVSDCFEKDAQGLQKNLCLIDTVSLESGSEGPEMMISSEEGDDLSSVRLYQNDPQIFENYKTFVEECWNFSYVVDVVVESGLETRNLETERKSLQLQDYVINPTVFESLEKKYGKSMPWERSERRLLFDRLSSGLLEIVKPSVGLNTWRQPVAGRFRPRDRSQKLEEELWLMLVKQQQEMKRDSSDKVCQKEIEWLDLEEDTNMIVQELESLLLDEVVEEFVSLEISCF